MFGVVMQVANLGGIQDMLERIGAGGNVISASALNEGAAFAKKIGGDAIMAQVEFPAGYLDLPDRFGISTKATPAQPIAVVTARRRATSLATFITGVESDGVSVKVSSRKGAKKMERAFVFDKLKAGNRKAANRGLAIRTRGEKPDNSYKPKKLFSDNSGVVWLLYGPSVNQVFTGVSAEILPKVSTFIQQRALQLINARLGQ